MIVYADTSALAAVIFDEPASEQARDWFKRATDRVIVSDLARLEFAAIVTRAVRTGRFNHAQAARAFESFDMFRAASQPMTHGRDEFAFAEWLARDLSTKLSAPDALHLWRLQGTLARRWRRSTQGSLRPRGRKGWRWRRWDRGQLPELAT